MSTASVHVGVRTGIGHGPFVGTACARRRRRFVNGKRTTTSTTTTNGGRETRNEVRTAKGYDAPFGRISYPGVPIGGGTRTPRTEKTKSTVIRFGRGTLSGRGNIIATHGTTIIAYTNTADRAQHS